MSGYIANTGYQFPIQNYDGTTGTPVTSAATTANTNGPGYLWAAGLNTFGKLGNQSTVSYSSPIQIGSLTTWKQISSGGDHMAAVVSDGTLWTSGLNQFGQLGNGNTILYSSPIQVGSLTNWSQVATGYATSYFTAAIKTDGTLWSWGSNSTAGTATGQLGNGNTLNYSSPIQIGSLTNWSKVSLGWGFAGAIKTDGTLWTWGDNQFGQLGYEIPVFGTTNVSSPVLVAGGATWANTDPDTIILSSGTFSSVLAAIKTDGTLWVCGDGTDGSLGNGATLNYSSPIQVGSLTNWSQVSSGGGYSTIPPYTLAVKTDGTMWAWGTNGYGQLGNGTITNYSSPIQVGSLTNWSQVSCGVTHTAAIKTNGTLWTWGDNSLSQLGNGTVSNSYSSPIQIGALTNWKQIACGRDHTVAVKTDGTLWGWGANDGGQLGNGLRVRYDSPIQVGSLTNWKQVSCGLYTTMAVKTDGTLWGWGDCTNGELGNTSNNIQYSSPIQIGALTNWKQVSIAFQYALAVKTDGTLWGWGTNSSGVLGNLTTGNKYSSPIQVGALTTWKQVVARGGMFFGYTNNNYLYSCGYNNKGRLGAPSSLLGNSSSPIQIGALTNWSQISAGNGYTAAIKNDGTLWAWGNGTNGVLGNGTTTRYSSPIQIGALTNWSKISSGDQTVAVKTDGTLWAWGYNTYGQLGNGTTTNYSSPIQVGLLTTWSQVSTSERSVVAAIKTDGTLWTWGRDGYGQLGNGTVTSYSSPIQVGALTNWNSVSMGSSLFAIQNSVTNTVYNTVDMADMFTPKDSFLTAGLWGWGATSFGALGNGTTSSYSSPIQVGSLTTWRQVSAGYYHSLLTKIDGTLWGCGYNTQYQLGNGVANTGYSSPIQIGALTNWKQAAAGVYHSAAIKTDGTLWTWGSSGGGFDNSGALGTGTNSAYASPVQVGLLTNWKQVSIPIGVSSTLAIKTDGTLWSCGYNGSGQLGYEVSKYGTSTVSGNIYGATWANTDPDTTILYHGGAGSYTNFWIGSNGSLWGAGLNDKGQLGNGTTINYSSPIQIGSLTTWKQVTSGFYANEGRHTAAVKTDGTLWTWGNNGTYGQLGNGTVNVDYSSPVQVGTATNWKQVSAGSGYFVAVKTDGTLWAWGYNYYGTLGNNTAFNSFSSPVQIGTLTNWSKISTGVGHTAAIKTDGTLWTWGGGVNNTFGYLGNGTAGTNYSSPVQVGTATNWKQVTCGLYNALAVKTDGTLWGWGRGDGGQLGNGRIVNYSSPIQIGSLTNWKQVASGGQFSTAVKTDGTLWQWGNDGYVSTGSSPVQVGTATNWVQVNCGYFSSFAYASNNTLYGIGRNQYGQIGVPSTLLGSSSSPIQIGSLTNWKQISGTAAVKTDGTLWAWGQNNSGQLGNGTRIDYSSPIQIGSLTGWKQVSSGNQFKFAIKTDGTLWAWGQNNSGQLGNGTRIDYSSPIQIGSLTSWKQVAAGYNQMLAIKTDGTLWACGYNTNGGLGNGTVSSYSSPIQIGSLTSWKQVSSSINFNLAIQAPDYYWNQ